MKKYCGMIAIFMILLLASFNVCASDQIFSDYTEFTESDESLEIEGMATEILNQFRELYVAVYNQIPDDFPENLDFTRISKVYVDTNIEEISTSEKAAIESVLSDSNYVWVIPVTCDGKNFYITLARALPLDESKATALTEEQKQQVRENEGKWIVTEIAERPISPYCDSLEEKTSNVPLDDAVLIGGIPGMQMPIALGFQDSKAKSWIKMGYEYPVMENVPTAYSGDNNIYDFDIVLQKLHEYESPQGIETGGAIGEIKDLKERSHTRFYVALGSLILMCGVIIFFNKKRNRN